MPDFLKPYLAVIQVAILFVVALAILWFGWHLYSSGKEAQALKDQPRLTASTVQATGASTSGTIQTGTLKADSQRVVKEAQTSKAASKGVIDVKSQIKTAVLGEQETPIDPKLVAAYDAALERVRDCGRNPPGPACSN